MVLQEVEPDGLELVDMKRAYLLVAAVACLLMMACNRDPQAMRDKCVRSGNKYFQNSRYKEASILYRRALQFDPKSVKPITGWGWWSWRWGSTQTLREHWNEPRASIQPMRMQRSGWPKFTSPRTPPNSTIEQAGAG